MTRNTKIALGCGGGGCLGLILLVILVAILIVTGIIKAPGIYSPPDRNSNYNYNRNSNYNSNLNRNSNSNTSTAPLTMSDDDKHRLLLAASATQDTELIQRVIRKLGFFSGTGDDYAKFIREHATWAMRNGDFYKTVNTPEKARAYVNAHIDD